MAVNLPRIGWTNNNPPAINANNLNKMEQNVEDTINEAITLIQQNKKIWEGNAYEPNTNINLNEPLILGKQYMIKMYGLSSVYYVYYTFIYDGAYIQFSYVDPEGNGFRYRLDALDDGNKLKINSASLNISNNTSIAAIYQIN